MDPAGPARPDRQAQSVTVIGGLVAAVAVLVGVLQLWDMIEERRLRRGQARTLDEIVLPAELRLVSEDYKGNRWCLDVQ